MIPIVCVVGASNSGKTTVIEKLIPILTKRGYRVGTIKHDIHGFEMDREGKDTWKHKQAGAQTIAIASPHQVASIKDTAKEMPLEEAVRRYFWEENIILAEGYKRSHYPKIEVFRSVIEIQPICTPEDNLMAVVADEEVNMDLPRFGFDQIEQLADLIEQRFLKVRSEPRVLVQLDGKKLPMKNFVQDFLCGSILGMLRQLRGWSEPKDIQIHIRMPEDS